MQNGNISNPWDERGLMFKGSVLFWCFRKSQDHDGLGTNVLLISLLFRNNQGGAVDNLWNVDSGCSRDKTGNISLLQKVQIFFTDDMFPLEEIREVRNDQQKVPFKFSTLIWFWLVFNLMTERLSKNIFLSFS